MAPVPTNPRLADAYRLIVSVACQAIPRRADQSSLLLSAEPSATGLRITNGLSWSTVTVLVASSKEEEERGGDGGGVWGKAFEDRGVADETHEFLYFERVKLKNRRSKEQ